MSERSHASLLAAAGTSLTAANKVGAPPQATIEEGRATPLAASTDEHPVASAR